jgi:glycogen debranching enzyme
MIKLSGKLASQGLPTTLNSQSDLDRISQAVKSTIEDLKLWQFYVVDVEAEKKAVGSASPKTWDGEDLSGKNDGELVEVLKKNQILKGYRSYAGRFVTKSDPAIAAGFAKAARSGSDVSETWGRLCDIINVDLYSEANDDAKAAQANIIDRLKYTRLDEHGPRLGEISEDSPLIENYFTHVPESSKTSKFPKEALSLANNGWIWAADPLSNFAEYPGKAYVRREVIAWGDCVKLRYGKSKEDNPWLWDHITSYCELLAELFDGFRLDNCHSTPLAVGVHMIDAARAVNPNLYVMAELFTGSSEMDLKFVSQIGINSLVREAYNGNNPKEFSGLLYEFGVTKAIGSMAAACLSSKEDLISPVGKGAVRQANVTPLAGSKPHAFFYDVTHDNETPLDKRTPEDALAAGALVTFTSAAIGSTKGFDDLYPKLLNLVSDTRMYEISSAKEENGIGKVKRVLNNLHRELASGGYVEGHVHQENDYIVMHRVHPSTHKGYLLVAHTAFNKGASGRGDIAPFKLSQQKVNFLCGATLKTHFDQYKESDKTFKSIPSELIEVQGCDIRTGSDENGNYSEVVVPDQFEPGSILLFQTEMTGNIGKDLDTTIIEGAIEAFADLSRVELNIILHRADGEEKDATGGDGVYDVPGLGPLVYCGLEGWMHPLRHVMAHNDLGHPLCAHLRQGSWAMGYIVDRLEKQSATFPGLAKPAQWLKERFDLIKKDVAPFLRPKYFAMVVFEAYKAARRSVVEQCSDFISSGTSFTHDLALCAIQMYGQVNTASIDPSKPVPSLAAGLPHFAAGWARCWGRDVFISLRGLFLTTGNFEAARDHILAFGSTLKHGLIPNLLDSCRNPRYNCRDGPWWFCQNIQDYSKMCPNGVAILKDTVKRRFPADDSWVAWDDERAYAYSSTVAELVQEILQRHAEGIEFREYNAGPNLDMDMKDEGFNQKIWVDWKTGIIFGGNRYNCGTWQDKMGSSDKAGNKGLPATPRDGAPIEITGLLKSTLTWVAELVKKGQFPFKGVDVTIDGKKKTITYQEWSDLLQDNFERCYWVPEDPSEDSKFDINPSMVNRRGIYKDVYGTPKDREWADYQVGHDGRDLCVTARRMLTRYFSPLVVPFELPHCHEQRSRALLARKGYDRVEIG